jgi:hypothetical protein
MIYGMDAAIFIGRVLLIPAAIATTAFPVLYMFSPWRKSALGQAIMLQSVTLSVAILLKLFLTFFVRGPARNFLLWTNVGILLLITVASTILTYLLWTFRRKEKEGVLVTVETASPLVSNKLYDFLKPTVTIVLPGAGALYFALAQIWGFPAAEQVVGTIAAVNVFLGLLIGVSSRTYNNDKYAGNIVVSQKDGGGTLYSLELNGEPEDVLGGTDEVVLRVNKG